MARYSLIAKSKTNDNERYVVKFQELDRNGIETLKEKVNLSTIDKLTLECENEEDLAEKLFEQDKIPTPNVTLTIEYMSKGSANYIDIAYKNLAGELGYYTKNAPVKVSVVDPKYKSLVKDYLNECLNEDFFEFQIKTTDDENRPKQPFLHQYNAEFVRYYIRLKQNGGTDLDLDRCSSIIIEELNRYKRIRGVILGTRKYYESIPLVENRSSIQDEEFDLDKLYFGEVYQGDRQTNQKTIEHRFINPHRVSSHS